jgi:hypothetical protein
MEFTHSGFVLCKPYMNNKMQKKKHFTKIQKGARKDVENCFGILQSQFATIQNPCKSSTNLIEIKLSIVSTIKVLSTFLKLGACD